MCSAVYTVQGQAADQGGRHLVATTDIPAGQLVIREDPVFIGPRRTAGRVCMVCCQGELLVSCHRCGLLLCQQCSSAPPSCSLHTRECSLLSQVSPLALHECESVHSLVCVARLLLTEGWDQLEGQVDCRAGTQAWEVIENCVVPVLMKIKGVDGRPVFTKERIHLAAGVIDTNAFELKVHTKNKKATLRCLYTQAARLNNSCVPNCTKEFSGDSLEIYTSQPVVAGTQLTICYTGLLQPSCVRQQIFRQSKHFQCGCQRCKDPTECGTYLSSILCPVCGGLVSPDMCQSCGHVCTAELQSSVTQLAEEMARSLLVGSDCVQLREGLLDLRAVLSCNHHILTRVKQVFIQHAGQCRPCRSHPSYLACSVEMLQLINKLQPGHTLARLDETILNRVAGSKAKQIGLSKIRRKQK
eukprot:GFUD01046913.1.p1 GENE.GFUD01046913.1~~GFUD01046913.1.p1  ORF type:complete len:413 (+),score=129.07 GFUD01046913.1:32-1270(+)